MVRTHTGFATKQRFHSIILFTLALFLSTSSGFAVPPEPTIVVNQAGYLPEWPKRAILISQSQAKSVALKDAETDALIMMIKPKQSAFSDLDAKEAETQLLDFSNIDRIGSYYLETGDVRSLTFSINKSVYKEPTRLLLRSYYLQRCGVELLDPETGLSHEACHLNDGVYARDDDINQKRLKADELRNDPEKLRVLREAGAKELALIDARN